MPEVDGIAVIRYLTAKHPHTRILAISGSTGNLPAPIGLPLSRTHGVEQVLYKPFSPSELRSTVARALANSPPN
jgi:CheY-like chemotaxis protein